MNRVDPSTLRWVKAEIDNTLKQARLALESYAENSEDATRLRFLITHLHQVVGTLQMVELDGAALLATEIETLAEAILSGKADATEHVFEVLTRAILSLSEYLEQLLAGRPDIPLRLITLLNELRAVRGVEPLSEVFLFNPDFSVFPPRDQELEEVSNEEYGDRVGKLRRLYHVSLLDWLRDEGDAGALRTIEGVFQQLQQLSRFGSVAQLWWIARGLVQVLTMGRPELLNKTRDMFLFRQLDEQIRKLVDGEAVLIREPADDLLKTMLFYVGTATDVGGLVADLRDEFDLAVLLPEEFEDDEAVLGEVPTQEALRSVAKALGEEIETAEELLGTYFDPDRPDVTDLDRLIQLLGKMSSTFSTLGVPLLKTLTEELIETCKAVTEEHVADHETASLQMAGALLLIENSSRELGRPGVDWQKQIQASIATLRGLSSGVGPEEGISPVEGIEISEAALTETEFKELLAVVAGEIRVNLESVEETLEEFASDTSRVALLETIPKHLNQIQGAIQILGQERVADLIGMTNRYIQDIENQRIYVDDVVLDALAVAIGTIEAYMDGLEHGRRHLGRLVDNAVEDLEAALSSRHISAIDRGRLRQDVAKNFEGWLADARDPDMLRRLQQNLREITSLADSQGEERVQKISEEMNVLLQIVAEDLSFLSEDIVETLKKSFGTLMGLVDKSLAVDVEAEESATSPETGTQASAFAETLPEGDELLLGEDEEVLDIFLEEARDTRQAIDQSLSAWAAETEDREALTNLRRAFHTLKGSGRLAGAMAIGELAWVAEDVLNHVLKGKIQPSEEMFSFLLRLKDSLQGMVEDYDGNFHAADLAPWRQEADDLIEGTPLFVEPAVETPAPEAAVPEDVGAAPAETPPVEEEGEAATVLGAVPDSVVLGIFTREARGYLAIIDQELEACSHPGASREVTSELLRAAHTLHSTSRSVGLEAMPETCERMEEMFDAMSVHAHELDDAAIDLIRGAQAVIGDLLESLNAGIPMSEELARRFAELSFSFAKRTGDQIQGEPWYVKDRTQGAEVPGEHIAAPIQQEEEEEEGDFGLQEIFHEEAVDILGQVGEALERWRTERDDLAAVGQLKRALHTLKGGARMAEANVIGDLSHNTESLLKKVEDGGLAPEEGLINLLEEVHDTLVTMVDQMQNKRPLPGIADLNARVLGLLSGDPARSAAPVEEAGTEEAEIEETAPPGQETAATVEEEAPGASAEVSPEEQAPAVEVAAETGPSLSEPPQPEVAPGPPPVDRKEERGGVVRVSTNLLDDLSNYAGEVSITRSRVQQEMFGFKENLKELDGNVTRFRDQIRELEIQTESQIMARPQEAHSGAGQGFDPLEFDRYSKLHHLSRGLAESLHDLVTIKFGLDNFVGDVETVLHQQARLNTELQEGLMRSRMVSFSTQMARLRHIVRQTARELGKRVELKVSGAEVEIDRRVLDRMAGPFEHMIRNAIDHGIETEEVRIRAGKPSQGAITIDCRHEANQIIIRFSDDGAGLDLDAIRKRARETGLIKEDTGLSDDELIQLIMIPGFTTAEEVTHLSGRGVGMDVVHSEVKMLGGGINTETVPGRGTVFSIRLPLTLSIMQALIVRAGEQPFAIPVPAISTIAKVMVDELPDVVADPKSNFKHRGEEFPFMHLGHRLGLSTAEKVNGKVPILMVRTGTHEAALQVDALLHRQEIVVKSVGPQIAELPGIAGATILGDGSVVLILDVGELWVTKEVAPAHEKVFEREEVATQRQPLIMVVDDSLTVRKVTDRSLRKRGMEVLMAKDGIDAWEKLRDARPDVMLVDIEMPRMDGYELTSRIRSDPTTRHIPIIIITSRSAQKHKDKAMELGANVYLTKPYQEEELVAHIEAMLHGRTIH